MPAEEKTRRPIGQILIDGGFIERRDLELALEVQKHSNDSSLSPAPRYVLKGVFSFKMGEYGPAA